MPDNETEIEDEEKHDMAFYIWLRQVQNLHLLINKTENTATAVVTKVQELIK